MLREVALLFLRLGLTAFGGPAVHIAMMEDEVVRRRKWLTRERFLDLLGATNLIPGPNSTEMAIHIGHDVAGTRGLVVAGACFIVPAALVTGALAWVYVRFGAMPEGRGLLYGVKPVILAIVVQAIWGLGRTAVKTKRDVALAVLAVTAAALAIHELVVLAASGLLAVAARSLARPGGTAPRVPALAPTFGLASLNALGGAVAMTTTAPFTLAKLFLFFAKVGSVLFGSGYVLLAFLRADLVDRWHWMTEAQLLDAIAIGQVTPGPVFTTATFIGYLLGGPAGAVVATLGIFLPAFVFVAISAPLVARIRQSASAGSFLDGVNIASLALMAVVTVSLARAALVDVPTVVLAALAAVLLLRFKVSSTWLVAGGALVGVIAERVVR